jgi:3D (Asp-Asp-Asp) domain-containing protein
VIRHVADRRLALLAALALPALAGATAIAAARPQHAPGAHVARAPRPLAKSGWLHGVQVTEYYPAPEAWFVGKKVAAPGLSGKHRIDWLYSASGVSMQGEGIGLDGRLYHIDALGAGGWVTDGARPSTPGKGGWDGGPPIWRAGAFWLTHSHQVTFPLDGGGWSNGRGRRYVPLPGVTFAAGPSKPLRFYRSIAVDPRLIPLGSLVYIDAYRTTAGGGWFRAQDTGGAILGRHVDVYRSPPAHAGLGGATLASERIYVIPPGRKAGKGAPSTRRAPATTPAPPPSPGAGDPSGGSSAGGSSGGSSGGGSSGGSSGGGAGAP